MSTESELNQPSASVETAAPTAEYVPMADPVAPTESKGKTYDGNDAETIREAAADLDKARAENRIPRVEDEPIDRGYRYYAGEKAGEPVEPEQTLDASRAARDLRMVREYEVASQQPQPADEAAAVDALRAQYGQQTAEAQPAQPEAQQQQTEHQAQPQQQPDGVHPDVVAALQNENVRNALAKEIASVEQARAQYAASVRGAAQLAGASLLASFPELANVPTNQLQGAIAVIAQKDPARAHAIGAALEKTQALYNASVQAQQAQAQIQAQHAATQQQQLNAWIAAEDEKFTAATANESPETMRKLAESVVELAAEYGVPKQELFEVWQSQPIMRSSAMQRILVDAARYRMAQKEVAAKVAKVVPPVQRPGVTSDRGANDYAVDAAMKAFRQNPGPQTGAALLQARRNSR